MAPLSLLQLLDDAIETTEQNVRFSSLHRLLRTILGHLNLQDLPVLEDEHGLNKTVVVSPDLLDEVAGIKAAQSRMAEDIQKMREALGLGNHPDAAGQLRDLATLDSAVKRLEERLSLLPAREELCDVVRWGELEDCLVPGKAGGGGRALQQQAGPGTPTITPGMQPGTSSTQTTTSGMQPTHPMFPEEAAGQEPHCLGAVEVPAEATPGAVATDRDATSTQLPQAGHPAAETLWVTPQGVEIPTCNMDASSASPAQEPSVPRRSSGSSSATSPYAEAEEALRQMGQLGHLYAALKEQVAQLEAIKVDHQELEKLRQFLPEGDEESITNVLANFRGQMSSLQGQMSSLQSLANEMQVEKEKIRQLEDTMGKLRVTGEDRREDGRHQTTEQLGAMMQEIKQQLKELGEQQDTTKATLEQVQSQMVEQEQEQKADKSALAGKVSLTQFDTCMERLTETIQEMLSRVTGLEQDWSQVQRQLSQELDAKLDRLELGPFQQQLEDRWKNIQEQLQKSLMPVAEDAAGIKKQLLQDFQCLSCDRPLSILVPGPNIMPLPSMPPLPPCSTGSPNTYQEQSQQQHREQEAKCRYPRVPRQCGGQHTLTRPLQRCLHLQPIPPSTPRPRQHITTELLGRDRHVSRAWTDRQLPVLVGEEGFLEDKPELSSRPVNPRDSSRLLSRPQSTRPVVIQPGTVASMHHRPASSDRHLSHASELLHAQQDGPSTPQDRMFPITPPSAQRLSRRAGSSSQK